MGSLVVPVCILLTYEAVLGERIYKVTGVASVYSLVPVCAVMSAVLGALRTSEGIEVDRQFGLLSRMWVLPVHRASPLTGRLAAEAVRALVGTIVITALGVMLGLRFTHGLPAALVFIAIPPIMVVGFTALVTALAVRSNARTAMTVLASVTISLAFLNPGITPIRLFPKPGFSLWSECNRCRRLSRRCGHWPTTAPRVAVGDHTHLVSRAGGGIHSACRARLPARRRVQRLKHRLAIINRSATRSWNTLQHACN